MADTNSIVLDRRDTRLSPLMLARVWRLAKPFWTQRAHWPIWLLAAGLLASVPLFSFVGYQTAHFVNDLTNAVVAKQEVRYVRLFWITTALGSLMFAVRAVTQYFSARLNLTWTRWMTDWMVTRYLAHRTYYDIALREDIDNPDQRIEGELPPVIAALSNIPQSILQQVTALATGGFIIAAIDSRLTIFVVIYTLMSTGITIAAYSPLIRFNFQVNITGADLRYGILHVRDNAETVAFYKGEVHEHAQIKRRIDRSINAQNRVLLFGIFMSMVQRAMMLAWDLAPFFLVVPLFFAGKIEYGAIMMAASSAYMIRDALQRLMLFLPTLVASAPGAVRLAQILERMDRMDAEREQEAANLISVRTGPAIRVEHVSLETPGGEQQLFRDLDFALEPGSALVIVGQTGVGKSSLLRAVAGLWRRGAGRIVAPPLEDCLFLPQRPYMILGDLRSQLLYPRGRREVCDAELQRILERVCLPHLLEKHGGLDAVRDWGKVLSLGEQQRVAFARILISGAKVVFLDEATSAIDIATEAALYTILRDEGLTYVSVGHRETILAYHERALELIPGGSWRIVPVARLRDDEVHVMGMARA